VQRWWKRSRAVLALFVAFGFIAVPSGRSGASGAATATTPRCGRLDLPETGLQGEVPLADQLSGRAARGYNCGLALVGHVTLSGAAANMAWAGHCAYVASVGTGINVIDVSDPQHPVVTGVLHGPGSDLSIETIAAKQIGSRAVLVAGRYGLAAGVSLPAPMDIYDATDCAHPKFVTTFSFPENIHNLTFSPDGDRVYATLPLQVVDVHDLAHPVFLGSLENQIPQPNFLQKAGVPAASYLAHEAYTSPDGNTLYLGGQTPLFGWFSIVDITGWPARPPVVLSQVEGRGHSIRLATIKGRTYALHSEESIVGPTAKGCVPSDANPFAGVSQPWLSDVTDPTRPVMHISQMTLAINDPANCATEALDGEDASVHYHDVDNQAHTTFVMASMWNAGLRVFDVRDPKHPSEVAYFNPGTYLTPSDSGVIDKAWGHVHYDAVRGQIWFATQSGGFWVVELEPQLRHQLGLPARPTLHPNGGAPRPPSTLLGGGPAIAPAITATELYCTLGTVKP
jgi:hypothetical protein